MDKIVELNILQFALVYLLLVVVLLVMKKCKINQTRLLAVASLRMTVQLVLAGLILTYIFKNPHPAFTFIYVFCMAAFAVYRTLSRHKDLNNRFKLAIALSLFGCGAVIVTFFVTVVVGNDLANPQYTIPLSGMIFG
ncbi:MAG: ABC transporter permease, partial [Oscillospiraceae bacterium]